MCGYFLSEDEKASSSQSTTKDAASSSPTSTSIEPDEPVSTWETICFIDEWGETSGTGPKSRRAFPSPRSGFPYGDVDATLYVRCTSAWIRFNDAPNLVSDDIGDGHENYRLPVRLDGRDVVWRAAQQFGSDDVNLPSSARSAWASANLFEALVPYYGERLARLSWSLTGSSDAISQTCVIESLTQKRIVLPVTDM